MAAVPTYSMHNAPVDTERPVVLASVVPFDDNDVATPTDQALQVVAVMAVVVPIEESQNDKRGSLCDSTVKLTWLVGALMILLVLLGVALAIVLSGNSDGDNESGIPARPLSLEEYRRRFAVFRSTLAIESDPSAFFDPNSPQSQALQWLVSQDQTITLDNLDRLTQRYAIMVLFYACGGENWSGYLTPLSQEGETNECDLPDFTCDEFGSIVYVKLINQEMVGRLPDEIGLLTALAGLNLANNDLEGTIPDALFRLSNLEYLNLGSNQFSSTISPVIGSLSNLQMLSLFRNSLTGKLPSTVSRLSNLRVVIAAENDLEGPFPVFLLDWPQLEQVDIRRTFFTGTLPTEIGLLTNLGDFAAWTSWLQGSIPSEIGLLSDSLSKLSLGGLNFEGPIPSSMGDLPLMRSLKLRSPGFNATIPTSLGKLTGLMTLSLGECGFTGTIPTELGSLTNLLNIAFEGSPLTGMVPSELGKLTGLLELNVARTELRGNIPDSVCATGRDIIFSCVLDCECCLVDCYGCPNTPQGCIKSSPSASPLD